MIGKNRHNMAQMHNYQRPANTKTILLLWNLIFNFILPVILHLELHLRKQHQPLPHSILKSTEIKPAKVFWQSIWSLCRCCVCFWWFFFCLFVIIQFLICFLGIFLLRGDFNVFFVIIFFLFYNFVAFFLFHFITSLVRFALTFSCLNFLFSFTFCSILAASVVPNGPRIRIYELFLYPCKN